MRLTTQTSISRATIGRRLAENTLKPWQEKMWCVPQIDATYVARMEDVLGRYTTLPRPGTAVVCVDETPQQLIGEVRTALPPAPGHPARHDYEYRRNGTANIFIAEWLRDLVDLHYAGTERILLVLDNLSTHTPAALYETFPPAEARRLCSRLEFHYVPKHASWFNMVEIEIGVLSAQCLDRRFPDFQTLTHEVDAWTRARNTAGARVRWMFGIEHARTKLGRAYPTVARKEAAA